MKLVVLTVLTWQLQTVTANNASRNVNNFDIWNPEQWKLNNQHGIDPGEIKFCHQDWYPGILYSHHNTH